MPIHALERRIATFRIRHGGFPYHLVILQLEHDASFRDHSPFSTMTEFLEQVTEGFAKGPRRTTTWCSRPTRWRTAASR